MNVKRKKADHQLTGDEQYDWLNCVECGGSWENCRYCPGLQSDPFICQNCLGGAGIYIHHVYCPTQHTNCPVDLEGKQICWWCKIHDEH